MTTSVEIAPDLTGPRVVALLYDGLCTFEFAIVAEIFGLARPELGTDWYRFSSCAVESGPLRAHGGFTILPDHDISALDGADLIVIPGWKGPDVPVPDELCAHLRRAHERGCRLASICSGAFVLAATGLLDGKVATTHWRHAEVLRRRFPAIEVDESSLYRQNDRLFTSAGSAAGIDLMIEIIRQDYGPAAANSVARRIVMPAHRSGEQAQFLERPVSLRKVAQIGPLLEKVRRNLSEPWPIARLAREMHMSSRTLVRRFTEAAGSGPGEWLANERLEEAKRLLVETSASVDEVADSAGFSNAHALRHHFRTRFGISPLEFRNRAAAHEP